MHALYTLVQTLVSKLNLSSMLNIIMTLRGWEGGSLTSQPLHKEERSGVPRPHTHTCAYVAIINHLLSLCFIFTHVLIGAHKSMSNECSKFIADMKRKYGERHINSEKQWPPCHSDKLVRLELVEREKGEGYSANSKGTKRTPLAYGDLFKVESGKRPVRKVLVEGDAGIGKTTLCIAVSEDWANGKLFQQFELVLLLPLRMKAVASAGTLPELLKLLDPGSGQMLCDSVARYFEGIEKGSNMLIIADGWDELSESERQEGSFLYQLIFHSMISVIVTSRPSASAPLHELPDIDRFVEVCGFSKEHIVEYIQSEFASDQEKAGRLLEQLEYNPLVESVCSVPLNCAIVCHLWRTLEEALPATMTELYTKIILNLVLQNIRKINTYKSVLSLPKFESLPSDLQQSWWLLCEFAFQALEKDQLVFSQEELEVFFPEGLALDKRILCFGLLQMADSAGLGISFHFLHLTFQEYLAALHLARQTPDKQLKIFHKHKANDRLCFEMVWKFFFGINDFNMASSYIQQYFECVAEEDDDFVSLSVCHCAFEARNDLINDEIAQFLSNHYSQLAFDSPHTTHDCSAVLYVIANIQECCDGYDVMIALNYARENQIKEVMHIIADKKGKILVTALLLRECRLTASGLLALESAVRDDLLAELEVLDLAGSLTSDAETNVEWLTTFVEAVSAHCPDLETLDLSCNRLANGVSVQIVDFDYLTKLKTLNKLTIPGHGALINDGTDINANFMETILATNSPYVKRLNLSYNNLGLPGVSAVSKTFDDRHSILILLHLHKTYLGDKGITILIKNHKVLSGLESVDNDNIRTTSVLCTADAGCPGKLELVMDFHNTNFSTLDLCHNPLGLEGTRAVGRILSSTCSQLLDAILCRCELTAGGGPPNADSLNLDNTISCETVGQQLCQMPQSSTITKLELDCNSFTGEGIHILAGFMHLCPCLNHLYTSDCSITSDDLIWLLDKLTQLKCSSPSSLCSELDYWYLYNNQIDDRGASALIDHLSSLFPRMVNKDDIILTNNLVSIEMLKRLEEELRNHKEIIKRQEEEEEQRNLEVSH